MQNKMKKTIVRLLFFILTVNMVAQTHIPTEKDYQNFLNSKTYVVLDENPMSDFNFMIKEVMPRVFFFSNFYCNI
jgi:hypothetical protein